VSESDQNKSENSEVALKAASILYNVSITGPTSILIKNSSINIIGIIKDNSGKVYANQTIGVDDGLRQYCTTTKTDKNGNINYPTKVNVSGVAMVTFIINNVRYPFIFQTVSSQKNGTYYTNSLSMSSLKLTNKSTKNLTVKTLTQTGRSYTQNLDKGKSLTVLQASLTSNNKRVTKFVGGSYIVPSGVGEISYTVDGNGVIQTTATVGELLYRGSIYSTTNKDVGLCWAPGLANGYGSINIAVEATICIGTDGINIGSSGSIGGVVSGYSIKVY